MRFENVATPATAFTVAGPLSGAPPGFAPMASVTGPVNAGVGVLFESLIDTTIGPSGAPATADVGCLMTNSAAGCPMIPEAVNVTEGTPSAVAKSVFVPLLGPNLHDPTAATPSWSVTCVGSVSEPPPVRTTNVTGTKATGRPRESSTRTV